MTFPPLVLVGNFSYSAYLWHWPFMAYYRLYISERAFTFLEQAGLIAVSLIMGYLSWRFVEERFRYYNTSAFRSIVFGACGVLGIVLISSMIIYVKGFPDRVSEEVKSITDRNAMWEWKCTGYLKPFDNIDKSFCVVGSSWKSAPIKGVVWGDSHSLHWAPLIDQLASMRGISFVIAPTECPPYLNIKYVKENYPKFPHFTEDCTVKQLATINWLNKHSDVRLIIMAAAWSGHIRMLYTDENQINNNNLPLGAKSAEVGVSLSVAAMRSTINALDLNNKHLLLLGDIPRPNRELNECVAKLLSPLLREECSQPVDYLSVVDVLDWHRASELVLKQIAAEYPSIDIISPVDALCGEKKCPTFVNGELIYKDNNHLRRNLTKKTMEELNNQIGLTKFFDKIQKVNVSH